MLNISNILISELILDGCAGQMTINDTQLLAEIDGVILMSVFCVFTLTPAYFTFNWEQHEELHRTSLPFARGRQHLENELA